MGTESCENCQHCWFLSIFAKKYLHQVFCRGVVHILYRLGTTWRWLCVLHGLSKPFRPLPYSSCSGNKIIFITALRLVLPLPLRKI